MHEEHYGIELWAKLVWYSPEELKLNKGGSSFPFGKLVLASLNSAKKLWAHASTGESLFDGVYSSSLLHSKVASGGTRGRNTWRLFVI